MEIRPNDHLIGVYFIENRKANATCWIKKTEGETCFHAEIRFRIFKDDLIYDSDDDKHFFDLSAEDEGDKEQIIKDMKSATRACFHNFMGLQLREEYLSIEGDFHKLLEVAKTVDWLNFKMTPKGKTGEQCAPE
jgi:hypothetical protein